MYSVHIVAAAAPIRLLNSRSHLPEILKLRLTLCKRIMQIELINNMYTINLRKTVAIRYNIEIYV